MLESNNKAYHLSISINLLLSLLLYRIALDLILFVNVAPVFQDHSLWPIASSFDLTHYLSSLILFLTSLVVIGDKKQDIINFSNIIAIIFYIAPISSLYGCDDSRSVFPVIMSIISILIVNFISKARILKPLNLRLVKIKYSFLVIICIFFIAIFLVWSVISGAISYLNFDIARIYEFRSDVSKVFDYSFFSYINAWTVKVFTIFLLATGIAKKNKSIIFFSLAVQLYAAALTSHRGVLFMPLLVVAMVYFYKSNIKYFTLFYYTSAILIVALIVVEYFELHETGALLFRRPFFVPASATYEWFDFFHANPHVFFSDKLLSGVVENQYTGKSLPHLMGAELVGNDAVGGNVGMVPVGFAQLGIFGVLLYSVVFGVFIKILSSLVISGVPMWVVASLMINPLWIAWTSSDLSSALLSHGMIVGVVLLSLYSEHENNKEANNH